MRISSKLIFASCVWLFGRARNEVIDPVWHFDRAGYGVYDLVLYGLPLFISSSYRRLIVAVFRRDRQTDMHGRIEKMRFHFMSPVPCA